MSEAYQVVRTFESAVARWVGAKYGVALDNCTNALFLSMEYATKAGNRILLPARTFISVPMAAIHAGLRPKLVDVPWTGKYRLGTEPGGTAIWDSAGQLARDSYEGGLMCVSFQYRKPLPIGKGGMVLTDDENAADWMRRARYCGRDQDAAFDFSQVKFAGWNMTMTPEQAARGLSLLELNPPTRVFRSEEYADLRDVPLFKD